MLTMILCRLVNIIGGVLVSGGWIYKLLGMAVSVFRRRKRNTEGMLNGRTKEDE